MVPIEFLNLIIKRSALDHIYAGGSAAFIKEHEPFDGRVNAYDEHLVKFGVTDSADIRKIALDMDAIGLVGVSHTNDEPEWADYCVIDELMGPTLQCDWIQYDTKSRSVSFLQA
jgi:hypothetical protein